MKRYVVGPLHLDVEQRVLYLGSDVVALSPKSFDILLVLVENAGQVMSRDAIREQVWGDAFIEDANLSNNISLLRSALREHLGDGPIIKTFSKRGYQFTLPVEMDESGERVAVRVAEPAAVVDVVEERRVFAWNTEGEVWKTRSNLILSGLLGMGIAVTLLLIRSARMGTLPQRRGAMGLLAGLSHLNVLLKSIHPLPSLMAAVVLLGIAVMLGVVGRRRPDLHTGNWLLALSYIVCMQIVWTVSRESAVRDTIGMLGQLLAALTLAAYKPDRARWRDLWMYYLDVLPLLAFVVCCGLDVKKPGIYVGLSALGRVMLLGTYLLRRNAWRPAAVAIVGWISMALLAASGQYRGAAFLAIAIAALYAVANLSVRLPEGNIGKPILLAGMLAWALYAATYPAAYGYQALRPLWSLLLQMAKLLVCVGMAVFVWRARPERDVVVADELPAQEAVPA